MENMESKDNLENSISKVLNSTVVENTKSCKKCGNGNSTSEKKCRNCNQIKQKVTPMIIISLLVFSFMVYGLYKASLEVISALTQ